MVELRKEVVELGAESGMGEREVYNLADQFRSVYPENWESLLTERLMQNKEKSGDRKRIAQKRELVRELENQLAEMNPGSQEKDLDKRIAELQKRIGKEESDG